MSERALAIFLLWLEEACWGLGDGRDAEDKIRKGIADAIVKAEKERR